MSKKKQNVATTVQVEECSSSSCSSKKTQGETNMGNVKENKTANTQTAVENEEKKGTSIMENQETEAGMGISKDKHRFYPPCSCITEDIAIRKLVILANSIAKTMNQFRNDCKMIISYKDLSAVIFSDLYQEILFENIVFNSFTKTETSELDNIIECFEDLELCEQPGLYYYINLPEKDFHYKMLSSETEEAEKADIIEFRDSLKGGINLFNIMTEFKDIKNAFVNYKLIDMTFTFNSQCGKNGSRLSTSTIVLKMDFLDNHSKKILEFTVTFDFMSAECTYPTIIAATSYEYSLKNIIMDPSFCLAR